LEVKRAEHEQDRTRLLHALGVRAGCAEWAKQFSPGRKEKAMAEAKKPNLARLLSLFVAFLGCVVVAVPIMFPLTNPAPLILVGSGVTVLALGLFLFFSF
jgi:protein-S-isoprenylcysteine O-methyltransferase Ste14